MTCNTPCAAASVSPASIYNHDYIEADASPMATQQRKWLESPSTFLDRLCALEPWRSRVPHLRGLIHV